MRSYQAARGFFSFVEFVAWAALILGIVVAVFGGGAAASASFGNNLVAATMGALPGLAVALIGLYTLVYIQSARASVDSAEYAQQSLKLSRDQFEVSKQLLRLAGGDDTAITYTSDTATTAKLTGVSYDTEAAQNSDAAPNAKPDVLEVIKYKGQEIERLEEHFRIGSDVFPNLAVAQAAVDKPMMRRMLAK